MKIDRIRVGTIDTICYLITSNEGNTIIIDPGAEPDKIIDTIKAKGLKPKQILLTHGHYDHIEAITPIKEKYNTTVNIHNADTPMMNYMHWERYLGRPFAHVSYDKTIDENDTIICDELSFKIITTPGHSPGSVSYLLNDCLFCGDTIFADGGIGRTDLWQGSATDIQTSLQKIFQYPDEIVLYPGHGNSSFIGKEKLIHSRFY